ncbi:MAG: leucine-rich repeat domain-containing protein [Candidatus Peribacteria bacterium]|nr:leucine-rich repeat domain-containing protein [Candidatus Peribacteria bacterium]
MVVFLSVVYKSFAKNKLSTIDPNIFTHLKNLKYLDIGGNPFGKLPRSYFKGLEQLSDEGDFPSFKS